MITLADDRLSFTFPEIARQLRAHVERTAGILTGAARHIEKVSSSGSEHAGVLFGAG